MFSDFIKDRINKVIEDYESIDNAREDIIRISRSILNNAVKANRNLSAGNLDEARKCLEEAFVNYHEANTIISKISSHEKYYLYRIIDASLKEVVEAILFYNSLSHTSLWEDILDDIPNKVFIEGLFDYVGELRRKFLEYLLDNNLSEAEKIVNELKELYDILSSLVLKSFYIPDFRKKLDSFRNILLKSMEDLVTAFYSKKGDV